MKNIFIILLIFSFNGLFSQETEQKSEARNGKEILPKAGDFAIGINALPYLNYLGNIFNNTVNNTLNLGNNNLYFKYFLTDNSAVRVCLNINSTKTTNNYYVQDDAARLLDPTSQAMVEDKRVIKNNFRGITLGYVMNRGYERVRGFYGGQIIYNYNRIRTSYQYGNLMTPENPNPSTNLWGRVASRLLEQDNGITRTIGMGLIAGVEYYFLPKVCIGGEATLQYNYAWGTQSNQKTEQIVGGDLVEMDKVLSPGDRNSVLNTIRPATYGGLYLMFNF
jgi:hypothetical protein